MAPNLTEIVFALGAGERLVGVTRFDDYPPQVEDIPRVGGFLVPSLEMIASLGPDLVVCVPNSGNQQRMTTLVRHGIAVLVLPASTLEDVYTSIEELGRLLQAPARASELVAQMRARAERVRARAAGKRRPRVLMVFGHRPLVGAGPNTFADDLLRLAGADNVLASSRVAYPTVPLEMLAELAPEVILDASASGTGSSIHPAEVDAFWRRFHVVPAVRTGRVHRFDSALWFRPGPRLVEGLEQLSDLLHPRAAQP